MAFSVPGFEILEALGQGATATVYRVRRRADGQLLALKRLTRLDDASRVLFRHEFWATKRLAHPNLVAAHEAGDDYFTLDLVEGPGLPVGPVALDALREVVVPLARALGYLHGLGLVHGDLKPENVRHDAGGTLRLLDLGFVQPAGTTGRKRGTPGYMAPEVIRGEPADPRSDLYALGAIAYRLLTGRLPYEPGDHGPFALLQAQLATDPPDLATARPDLPENVARALMSLLARDAADRPSSASQLLARLGWGEAEATFVGFGARLFGRDEALAGARASLAEQQAGRASALVLTGDAGVGKSRLLAALTAPPVPALRAAGGDAPYQTAIELLRGADALMEERGVERGDDAWQPLRALMPAWGLPPEPLEPRAQEAQLRQALVALLARLAGDTGLVVAIDDWDQSDEASVALLKDLMSRPNGDRLAWVLVDPRQGDGLRLLPLEPDAVAAAVTDALGEPTAPAGLADLAYERTLGYPARLREALAAWMAAGALAPRRDGWMFDEPRAAALALDLVDPAGSRLAELSPAVRSIVAAAAVLGPRFGLEQLAAMVDELPFDALASLEAAGLVVQDGAGYRFVGAARGAVLATVATDSLAALHRRAAGLYAEASDLGGLTLAARHWLATGDRDAVEVALRAARAALAAGALATARELLETLEALPELERAARAEASRLAGDVARMSGDGERALARYERAIELERAAGDERSLARELVSAGRTAMMVSRGELARTFLDEAIPLLDRLGERGQEARARMTLGRLDYFGGKAEAGREAYERAARLAAEAGAAGLEADALAFLGGIAAPNDPAGKARLERARAIHRRLQNPLGLIETAIALGDRLLAAGELAAADEAFREALSVARQVGSANEEAFARLNLAQTSLERGQPREALEQAEAARELAIQLKQRFPEGFARTLFALARLRLGAYVRAREDAAEAVAIAEAIGVPYLGAAAELARAQVALEVGAEAEAEAAITRAHDAERALGDPVGEARATWLAGRLALLRGDEPAAERVLGEALAAARTHGARYLEIQVLVSQAELAARKDPGAALEQAREAAARAASLGARELEAWAHWYQARAEQAREPARARMAFDHARRYAEDHGLSRLSALASLGLASVTEGTTAARLRSGGERTLRDLAREAGREGFERWPENRPGAEAPAGPAVGLAEVLAMMGEVRQAATLHDLATRLLAHLLAASGAQAGALAVYRELQVDALALSFMAEDEALDCPAVATALWEREPVFEGDRWTLPVVEDGQVVAVAHLADARPERQGIMPDMVEAMRLALVQFLQLQDFQARLERLALSESLARLALEGNAPSEVVRQALVQALGFTGAERALVLGTGAGNSLELVIGVDRQGALLPPDAPFSRTVCQWVLAQREPVRLVDAQSMEGWQQVESILALGLRTLVAVPLRRHDHVNAVLYVDTTDILHLLGSREQALLETAARVIAPVLASAGDQPGN